MLERKTRGTRLSIPLRCRVGVLVALCGSTQLQAERVIYVHSAATGAEDGESWSDAYVNLQDALDDVRSDGGCPCEIWTAAGTYRPDRGSGHQALSFEIVNDIRLYGGFAGWETTLDQRNPVLNETILSGDLAANDDPSLEAYQGCCWRYSADVCDEECLAEVAATRSDNSFNVLRAIDTDDSPVLDGFVVQDGVATDLLHSDGGGLYCRDSAMTVNRCVFRWNSAGYGGGVFAIGDRTLTVRNSLFFQNGVGESGPGAVAGIGSDVDALRITDCTFLENRTGGIHVFINAFRAIPIERCNFIRNDWFGVWNGGFRDIIGCTFIGNAGIGSSGTALWSQVNMRVINCRFLGNTVAEHGGAVFMRSGSATFINTLFSGNRAGEGNTTTGSGGAFAGGPGVHRFVNCTVVNNSAPYTAGGIGRPSSVSGCIFWGNTDQYGSTQYSQFLAPAPGSVNNSIVQGWTGSLGGVGNSGIDPMFVDPDGADDIPGTEDDDLRLSPDSQAIDAGDPNFVPGEGDTDLDGHARVLCGRVDIGAYESGIGDYNCDRVVDLADFSNWSACMTGPNITETEALPCPAFDFNADGDTDLLDLAAFQTHFGAEGQPPIVSTDRQPRDAPLNNRRSPNQNPNAP